MISILSLLTILTILLIVTRVATVALVHTGLSREMARFQARSAFTGVGFTTHESESIVNHPVRRRVVMVLMLTGNAGIISAIASLLLAFLDEGTSPYSLPLRIGLLVIGLLVLWFMSTSKALDQWLSRVITWALKRWTDIEVRDYASLLHLSENHQIQELFVEEDNWLAGRSLGDMRLSDEGVMVIGIRRATGSYIGAPKGQTEIGAGDVLLMYGRDSLLKELDQRCCGPQGDDAHKTAVEERKESLASTGEH
ncbi:MAG: TrkA C-terminal domain-containing protein [Kiritimatiellia bacterium]|nr:TrkA C-terminal domain-containing protein [Kiritimatiellia bacterium]MDP6847175.1 TrkA C-terminal domain-containing protein [Kiritimatiellia bacterium]